MTQSKILNFPVLTIGAEYLAMGFLMRRNILTYKAPPYNEGYDLICIHPDPRKAKKQIRVQVKSRYQTDCDLAFLVKAKSFDAFDYLIGVFLNVGYFFGKAGKSGGVKEPVFYTLPQSFVREHHEETPSGFDKLRTKKLDLERFKNEKGFDLIAQDLGIGYPSK